MTTSQLWVMLLLEPAKIDSRLFRRPDFEKAAKAVHRLVRANRKRPRFVQDSLLRGREYLPHSRLMSKVPKASNREIYIRSKFRSLIEGAYEKRP